MYIERVEIKPLQLDLPIAGTLNRMLRITIRSYSYTELVMYEIDNILYGFEL